MSSLIKDCIAQVRFIPRTIALTFIIVFAYLLIGDNNRNEVWNKFISIIKKPWLVLFLLYLSYVLVCTLLSRNRFVPYNSVLKEFKLYEIGSTGCIENILLLRPYTFFYLQAKSPSKSLKSAFLLAFITSLFIEFFQLVLWLGAFQISDLFYNVAVWSPPLFL